LETKLASERSPNRIDFRQSRQNDVRLPTKAQHRSSQCALNRYTTENSRRINDMKKMLIASFCICLLPFSAWSADKPPKDNDWYVINIAKTCEPDDISSHIKSLKEQGERFTESNIVKENGKIVSSKLVEYWDNGLVITSVYYRGLNRCKSALSKHKREAVAEENKYK
jgi:hypothetical protein